MLKPYTCHTIWILSLHFCKHFHKLLIDLTHLFKSVNLGNSFNSPKLSVWNQYLQTLHSQLYFNIFHSTQHQSHKKDRWQWSQKINISNFWNFSHIFFEDDTCSNLWAIYQSESQCEESWINKKDLVESKPQKWENCRNSRFLYFFQTPLVLIYVAINGWKTSYGFMALLWWVYLFLLHKKIFLGMVISGRSENKM